MAEESNQGAFVAKNEEQIKHQVIVEDVDSFYHLQSSNHSGDSTNLANLSGMSFTPTPWIIDYGATSHFTNAPDLL